MLRAHAGEIGGGACAARVGFVGSRWGCGRPLDAGHLVPRPWLRCMTLTTSKLVSSGVVTTAASVDAVVIITLSGCGEGAQG